MMQQVMSQLCCALLALFLAGCNTSSYAILHVSSVPQTGFGDSDPVEFGYRAPHTYPVHGIDVSKYQGDIDWQAVREAGVSFAFIKATEGGDRIDERFEEYWNESRRAGIPRGAYHFYYFCRPAIEQARWYIENVPRDPSALPPVLDMEWNPYSPTCTWRPEPERVRSEMRIFLDAIERHYGKKPIIYTTVDFHERNIAGHFKDYPMWLRSVAKHPSRLYPGHDWHFWQYTGTGIVPGIEGNADINVFAGDAEAWKLWLETAMR